MTLISIGDLARSMVMQARLGTAKAAVDHHLGTLSSGRHADQGKALNGDFAPLAALESTLSRLRGWTSATNDAQHRIGMMQRSLDTLDAAAGMAISLADAGVNGNPQMVARAALDAREGFGTAISALNVRYGDRSLFAGVATDRDALASPEVMLDALGVAVAGATTAAELVDAVDGWFASPAGFGATGFLGSTDAAGPIPLGAGDSVRITVTAADPGLRATLSALALGALLDRGVMAGNSAARATIAETAGTRLHVAAAARADVAAGLGIIEGKVAAAQARHSAEAGAIGIAISGMVAADPYKAATDLEAAQTQLETIYAVTARLSRLSLADYLR